jgi:ribonuclease HIII
LIEESAQKLINQYSELLKQSGFETSEVKKQQYCFEVVVKKNKDLLKLLVYFGKKGTKAILQGNEESELYAAVKTILFGDELFQIKKSELIEPDEYIGTDESGKGDYFGPLVIAGVYINADIKKELLKLGVKDSKQLTDDAIKKIAARVKHIKELKYNIVIINPARYNQLYNEIKNVNKLLAWGQNQKVRRIGILTGGFGDCPGLNAVIRGVTKPAQDYGMSVLGIKDGFEGLLKGVQKN